MLSQVELDLARKGANARVEELMKELRGMVGLTEVKESACAHNYILSKELQ